MPIERTETADAQMDDALQKEGLPASLSAMLAGLAILVTTVGWYGLLAYSMIRRTYEIGIRIALGASRNQIRWLAIWDSVRRLLFGIVSGGPAYLALSRLFRAQLYHVRSYDPITVSIVVSLLLLCGALATYLPASRSCRVDPVRALKYE